MNDSVAVVKTKSRPTGRSTVKRLCMGCCRLYPPGEYAYTIRGYQCVCVGCNASEEDSHPPQNAGTDFTRRYVS